MTLTTRKLARECVITMLLMVPLASWAWYDQLQSQEMPLQAPVLVSRAILLAIPTGFAIGAVLWTLVRMVIFAIRG